MPQECLDLQGLSFLAVSIRGKLEVKRGPKEMPASSNGHQQLLQMEELENLVPSV